jgi:hypothetical protein
MWAPKSIIVSLHLPSGGCLDPQDIHPDPIFKGKDMSIPVPYGHIDHLGSMTRFVSS